MKKTRSVIALILALSIFLPTLLPLSSLAAELRDTYMPDLDYSDPDRAESQRIPPSELLSMILQGETITEAEAEYLDLSTESFLLINSSFSNDRVSLYFDGERINVTAMEYEYTANNGERVLWTPIKVSYKGSKTDLSASAERGAYTAQIYADPEENAVVSIDYTCTLPLSADTVDYIVNRAYRDATAAKAESLEYDRVLGEYMDKYHAYESYLSALESFEINSEKYREYISLKAEYERELIKYNKYLTDLAAYERDLAEYKKYQIEYDKYTKDKAEYDKVYFENIDSMDEYIEYYAKIAEIDAKMYAMESIYVDPDDLVRELYAALQNKELVAMFEKYKDELSLFGVSKEHIDHLSATSDELNALLVEYNTARETSKRAAFDFYCANYDEICQKFNYLYDSMIEIMEPKIFIKIGMKIELDYKDPKMATYKKWRILNVLSQIYLVSRCLDDSKSPDEKWSFFDYEGTPVQYDYIDLLSPTVILKDTNDASPEGLVWPDEVPTFTLPPLPIMPEEVTQPLKPEVVDEPTAPTVVVQPTPPTEVENPGAPPAALDELFVFADIIDALDHGTLTERRVDPEGVKLSFTHSLQKLVSFDNLPIVTVYDHDLSTVISQYIAQSGTPLNLPSTAPARAPDTHKTYSFLGWSLSPDEEISTENASVTEDTTVYARYAAFDRLYSVRWITPTGESVSQFKYGETPVFSGSTEKPPTDTVAYVFKGWFPLLKKVSEDIEYTADYTETERKYTVKWQLPSKTLTELYSFEQMPSAPDTPQKYFSGTTLFEFVGWDKNVSPVTADITYTALYEETLLADDENGAELNLTSTSSAYELTSAGNTLNASGLLSLAAKESKRVLLTLDGVVLSIDKTAVSTLAEASAERISITTEKTDEEITSISLKITSEVGNELTLSSGEMRIKFKTAKTSVSRYTLYENLKSGDKLRTSYIFSDGEISFVTNATSSFSFTQLYSITVLETENGATALDKYLYEAGTEISPIFYPAFGYEPVKLTLKRADTGESIEFNDASKFVMPNSDVTLTVTYDRIRYTVNFVVRGEVVSTARYLLGEIPKEPKIEDSYTEDGVHYKFSGWSPSVAAVTGDVTYTAQFVSLEGPESTIRVGDSWDAYTKQTILPVLAIAVLCAALTFAAIVIIKDKRKKKKKKLK